MANVHDQLARIYNVNQHDFEGAVRHWQECMRLSPTNIEGVLGYSVSIAHKYRRHIYTWI